MSSMALLLLAVAGLLAGSACGQIPDWQTSPAAFLSLLAQMPVQVPTPVSYCSRGAPKWQSNPDLKLGLQEQRVYLQIAGAQLQSQTDGECNIFGGEAACQRLPETSHFAQKCPNHDLQVWGVDSDAQAALRMSMLTCACPQVDCAYYAEDMAEAQDQDPADRLRDSLKSLGAAWPVLLLQVIQP